MASAPVDGGEPLQLQIGGLQLAARRWGRRGDLPMLAVHGWLDNCASFGRMAAALPGVDLVCLDLAGHGLSDARPHLGAYNICLDVGDLFAAADQLNWPQFSLLGHSRGAAVSFIAAGTFPDRIKQLFLLEGVRPTLADPQEAPQLLSQSILTVQSARRRARRYYPDFDEAARARTRGFVPVNLSAARLLAARGVAQDEHGFYWRHDPQAAAVSEMRMSQAQLDAFAAQVRAPTQLFLARGGLILADEDARAWLAKQSQLQQHYLPGEHHFHMGEQGDVIARHIVSALRSN